MESCTVHQQLLNPDDGIKTRQTLICYLQYLVAYRRDVAEIDEYIVQELQGLLPTKYIKQLQEDDPIQQILQLANELDLDDKEYSKTAWTRLEKDILKL